ncbi:hypothetical protein ACS3SW_08655 [Roseobacteraceae bacterium S113]
MTEQTDPEDRLPKRTRSRGARIGLWSVAVMAVLLAVVALALWVLLGRPITAPDWLRDRVEARIEALVPGVDVSMSAITIFVDRELNPEVSIENLRLADTNTGRTLLELTRADADLSRAAALSGQVQAKQLSAAGLFLTLRREADGSFDLSLGGGLGQRAPDLATLLRQIDETLENPQLAGLAQVTLEAVTLDYQDAVSGRAWLIDGGRISGTRGAESQSMRGDFVLLAGGADVTTVELSASSPIGAPDVQIGLRLDNMPAADIATQSNALSWLGVLDAPISGALRTGFDASGALLPLNATLQIAEGALRPTQATRPIPFSQARAYFTFDAAAQVFDFSEISVTSDWVEASATGQALLETDATGTLDGLIAQLQLTGITANPFALYETPRALDAATLDMHVGLDPFEIRIGQLSAQSGVLNVTAQGRIRAEPDGWRVSAAARAPEAHSEDILAFWPRSMVPGTRGWIEANVREAQLRHIEFVLQSEPQATRPKIYLGSEIAGGNLQFIKTMPPLTDMHGRLTLDDNRLVIVADDAKVTPSQGGAIDAGGTVFTLQDVRARPGQAEVRLRTQSTVSAALALIDNAPLNVMSNAGRPVDIADGRASLGRHAALSDPKADHRRGCGLRHRGPPDGRALGQDRGRAGDCGLRAGVERVSGRGRDLGGGPVRRGAL